MHCGGPLPIHQRPEHDAAERDPGEQRRGLAWSGVLTSQPDTSAGQQEPQGWPAPAPARMSRWAGTTTLRQLAERGPAQHRPRREPDPGRIVEPAPARWIWQHDLRRRPAPRRGHMPDQFHVRRRGFLSEPVHRDRPERGPGERVRRRHLGSGPGLRPRSLPSPPRAPTAGDSPRSAAGMPPTASRWDTPRGAAAEPGRTRSS